VPPHRGHHASDHGACPVRGATVGSGTLTVALSMPCSWPHGQLDESRGRTAPDALYQFEFSHVFVSTPLPRLNAWQQSDGHHRHRAFSRRLVNWTLVTDGHGVMLIDAAFRTRDECSARCGNSGSAWHLRAILLTHAHIDHFGSAIWFAKTLGTPVYCYAAEVGTPSGSIWSRRRLRHRKHNRAAALVSRGGRGDHTQGAMTRERIPSTQALRRRRARLPGKADWPFPRRATRRACSCVWTVCSISRRRAW